MTPDNPHANTAAGTRLERWFNDHPKTTTAGMVAFALLLLVLGGLLDGVPQ